MTMVLFIKKKNCFVMYIMWMWYTKPINKIEYKITWKPMKFLIKFFKIIVLLCILCERDIQNLLIKFHKKLHENQLTLFLWQSTHTILTRFTYHSRVFSWYILIILLKIFFFLLNTPTVIYYVSFMMPPIPLFYVHFWI